MSEQFKRWYDYDPLLLKVINLLKDYQDDLKEQAEIFLSSIEEKVSKDVIDNFCKMVKPVNGGLRWYDKDPVISKTIELLRVIPSDIQHSAAQNFIDVLKKNGIEIKKD